MKQCRLDRKNQNKHHAKTIIFSVAVIGLAFCVADMGIIQNADALLGVIAGITIAAVLGYLLGSAISAGDTDIYTSSAGGSNWDNTVYTDSEYINNFAESSSNSVDNYNSTINADFLFYGRLAENKVVSFINESVWNEQIEMNLTFNMMLNYSEFIKINTNNMDFIFSRLIAKAQRYQADTECPVGTRAQIFESASYKSPYLDMGDTTKLEFKTGNFITIEDTWFKCFVSGKILLTPKNTGNIAQLLWQNLKTGELGETVSLDFDTLGGANYYIVDLEPGWYDLRINVGNIIIQGGIPDDTISTYNNHCVVILDYGATNNYHSLPFNTGFETPAQRDFVHIWNGSISRDITPKEYTKVFNEITKSVSTLEAGILDKAKLRWNTYKFLGYENISDIPANEIMPPVDILWYDLEQMQDFDYDDLYMMWLAYLLQLSNMSYDYTVDEITPYDFNWTDVNLVVNGSIIKCQITYDSDGNITNEANFDILHNNTAFVVFPLEKSLSLTNITNKTMNQNFMIYVFSDQKSYTYYISDDNRISGTFTEYYIDVNKLYDDGQSVESITYDITTMGDWIEGEYQITPYAMAAVSDTAILYLYAGVAVLAIGIFFSVFEYKGFNLKEIAMPLIYIGIIIIAGYYLYYYVYPYLISWWDSISWWN